MFRGSTNESAELYALGLVLSLPHAHTAIYGCLPLGICYAPAAVGFNRPGDISPWVAGSRTNQQTICLPYLKTARIAVDYA